VVADTPFRYDLGCSFEVLGRVQGRNGLVADAKESLSAGLEILEECGARWHVERVKKNMADLGVRRTRRQSTDSLTKRELTTSRAAASGSSNDEIASELFVSLRTVEFHLSNTYRKLGISGRGELVAALNSLDSGD
jgi:DNA-binding NarL/FixJ family response regulator